MTQSSSIFRSSSSSSGDNLTDDSGIHSKSTSKDSPRLPPKSIIKYNEQSQQPKIERVAVGRKPVRKLPAVPNSKQAHIVQLKTEPKKSSRALPKPPDENPSPKKGGLRLTNFFRSVKFPKNKKIQPAPVRIFGRDLGELAKATNLEGNVTCLLTTYIVSCLFSFASCLFSLQNYLLPIPHNTQYIQKDFSDSSLRSHNFYKHGSLRSQRI